MAQLDLAGTLRSLDVQLDTVQQVGGRTAIVTRMPILEQGRLSGAVLLCQDPAAIQRLDRSLRSRSQQAASRHARYELSDLVGQSSPMRKLRAQAQACAQSTATTLIIGESGTGKELLAQGIHSASARRAFSPPEKFSQHFAPATILVKKPWWATLPATLP